MKMFTVLLMISAIVLGGCAITVPRPVSVPMPTVAASSAPAAATCESPGQWVAKDGQWVCVMPQRASVVPYYYPYPLYPYYAPYYYGPYVRFCLGCRRH